jgi:hypothetical protein
VNASLQAMNRPAHDLELRMIVSGNCGFSLRLQLANARLDARLIDADDVMMFVLNTEGLRERADQVLFVHLRVALDRFVFDAFGDFAQFGDGFMS